MRLSQPRKQRFRFAYDHSRSFEKFIGRTLTPRERAIIYALEKSRHTGQHVRCEIFDSPDFDSRPLLAAYLKYLDHEALESIIVGTTMAQAREYCPKDSPCKTFSAHQRHSLRGHSYRYALILDAHKYPKKLRNEILPAIAGTVLLGQYSLVIIHSRKPPKDRRPPAFAPPDPPPKFGVISESPPDKIEDVEIFIEVFNPIDYNYKNDPPTPIETRRISR